MNELYEKDPEGELYYYYLLSNCLNIGVKTYRSFLNYFESPKKMFLAGDEKRAASGVFSSGQLATIRKVLNEGDKLSDYKKMKGLGINYICLEDILFPEKLKRIHDCPIGLFYIGRIPFKNVGSIGLIGARECSFYGEEMAREIGSCLGDYNLQVISGMARGVDAIGQTACLDAGGLSFAVLGGGVDICYPRESRKLYERLSQCGGIISEYPPGVKPQGMYFVRRNRIISGMSDLVCVVEARKKSGTLITVDCALEQGKDVVAVPGKVTDITSRGCNELIAQGARILSDVDEFASECAQTYGSLSDLDGAFLRPVAIKTDDGIKDGETYGMNIAKEGLNSLQKELIMILSEDSFNVADKVLLLECDYGSLLIECLDLCDKKIMINMGAGRFRLSSLGISLREQVQKLGISKNN